MRHPGSNDPVQGPATRPLTPTPQLQPANVMALIVTYHPDAGVAARMRPLLDSVGGILFVDNGSEPAETAPLEALLREPGVQLLRNDRNVGVATALNQGFKRAADRGFVWVLTLDQDTAPSSAVVSEAARVLAASGDRPVAVVGAGRPDIVAKGPPPLGDEVAYVITAGALNAVGAWRGLGGFRDDFFIDYVDIEYCLRARAAGYAVLRSGIQTTGHKVGEPTRHQTGLRGFTTSNHDRTRRYYITRNRIIVWRAYAGRERAFAASDLMHAAKEFVKLVLFESDRGGKMRAIARGLWDGIRGITGEAAHR